jgi:hypothetical protein
MRKCPECAANRYRVVRGRKLDLQFLAPLAGAVVASAAMIAMELIRSEAAVRADPRMWIVVALRSCAFAFLLVFWAMDPWLHLHPIGADARYNRPLRGLSQILLRGVITGLIVGALSGGLEDLLLR